MKRRKRIMIIKPSSLGDIFHTFPALEELRKAYPHAYFEWLVSPAFASAVEYCPGGVHRVIFFERRKLGNVFSFFPALIRLLKALRRHHYDVIIDFQGLLRSSICAYLAKGKTVVGWEHPKEALAAKFYTIKIADSNFPHAVDKNLHLVRTFLNQPDLPSPAEIKPLPVIQRNKERIKAKLGNFKIDSHTEFAAIIPGTRWESKRFPEKFYAELIDKLYAKRPGLHFVLIGGPDDRKHAHVIRNLTNCPYVFSLAGKTHIGELVELLRSAVCAIGADSGPLHIAAAVQTPCFCFFSSTDPVLTGPYGKNHKIYQRKDLPCICCMERMCPEKHFSCHQLSTDEISSDIVAYIQTHGRPETQPQT